MSRDSIFSEITQERDAQDVLYGGAAHDDRHGPFTWIALLTRHLGLAVDDGGNDSQERFRRQMLRVAALAVAALESHDRLTGCEQVAGDHERGSGF